MATPSESRRSLLPHRQLSVSADMLIDSAQPLDPVIDLFICGNHQSRFEEAEAGHELAPLAGVLEPKSQPTIENVLSSDHPQDSKPLLRAMNLVAGLDVEHHGGRKTGRRGSPRMFEHRWPHRRDRAEGRNHRLPSN